MDSAHIYRHFCLMARALEVLGERWSLLIVRDLLFGPKRFTDLARSLSDITPTRLTDRLRHLEGAGILVREPPTSGREVWYRLAPVGRDLAPVVEALTLWGMEHRREPPIAGEPVHSEPVMLGTKVWLERHSTTPADRVVWAWRFPGDDWYTLRSGGPERWDLTRGQADAADVNVVATPEAWARFLTTPPGSRQLPVEGIELDASRRDARRFAAAFGADLSDG
jgi:DNA-binding HxlR family transcriptional regulator